MTKAPKTTDKPDDAPAADESVQKVAIVPNPDTSNVEALGAILTPEQLAGLAPLDPAKDAEQAAHRQNLVNMQTDHELENALDPVSGGPSPGVTEIAPLSARATGAPITDMSGRPPLAGDDKVMLPKMREALQDARTDDAGDEGIVDDEMKGWRTPLQMGIPGGVVARIFASLGEDGPVESERVPNGQHFPETGTRYRLK